MALQAYEEEVAKAEENSDDDDDSDDVDADKDADVDGDKDTDIDDGKGRTDHLHAIVVLPHFPSLHCSFIGTCPDRLVTRECKGDGNVFQ